MQQLACLHFAAPVGKLPVLPGLVPDAELWSGCGVTRHCGAISPGFWHVRRFSAASSSSCREPVITKILLTYTFQMLRLPVHLCGRNWSAFKCAGQMFVLLYITLHSLYFCRLFTSVEAKLFFGRWLCLPACVCSTVLCNALSHLCPAWLETCCCLQSLPAASDET